MAKDKNRVQRYRLTCEFVLRDRGDYHFVRAAWERHIRDLTDRLNFNADYLAIEKVENHK